MEKECSTSFYLFARPETVFALISTGKLPDKLPNWVPQQIICVRGDYSGQLGALQNKHQTFILELDLPADYSLSDVYDHSVTSEITLSKIETSWIKGVHVFSQRGSNFLAKLCNTNPPRRVTISPDLYHIEPQKKQEKRDRNSNTNNYFSMQKRLKGSELSSPELIDGMFEEDDEELPGTLTRLNNRSEHIALLQKIFREATRTILVTSYAVRKETLKIMDLYRLTKEAIKRGVKIYIYFNDQKDIDQDVFDFFESQGVLIDEMYSHSKILAMDNELVAMGSFNWLSALSKRYPTTHEGTIVYQGEACPSILRDIWSHIKYYRNQQFSNGKQVNKFKRKPYNQSAISYELASDSELIYIPTLDQHRTYFSDALFESNNRVIICSPFISMECGFWEDIDDEIIEHLTKNEIELVFVCNATDKNLAKFRDWIVRNLPQAYIVPLKNFHLKTIVIDDDAISEGSFNWLSASRDEDSEYHNHEATLVVEGALARDLIQNFYQSSFGIQVIDALKPSHRSSEENSSSFSK